MESKRVIDQDPGINPKECIPPSLSGWKEAMLELKSKLMLMERWELVVVAARFIIVHKSTH